MLCFHFYVSLCLLVFISYSNLFILCSHLFTSVSLVNIFSLPKTNEQLTDNHVKLMIFFNFVSLHHNNFGFEMKQWRRELEVLRKMKAQGPFNKQQLKVAAVNVNRASQAAARFFIQVLKSMLIFLFRAMLVSPVTCAFKSRFHCRKAKF